MNHNKIEVFPVLLSRLGDDHLVADGSFLPMGCLTSYIKNYKGRALLDHYVIHRLVNRTKNDWKYYLDQAELHADQPAIWLFSSYVWNAEDNLAIARQVKERSPHSLIIMGGPHIPGYKAECEDFFAKYKFVDVAVRGEGENTLAELLEWIAGSPDRLHGDFSSVSGISFRSKNGIIRTTDRVRSNNLGEFPSPFLTGEFDDKSFMDMPGFVLETNRGCPYGCTYCDWGSATLQKIRHFDLDRVKKDIDHIGKMRAYNLHIADANFGAFERDVEIAQAIVDASKKYGYPKKCTVSNAKNASEIIGRAIKTLTDGGLITQGVVAIQTIDEDVLKAVDRSNIKTKNFEKLMDVFKNENLVLASELLIGLPGQTYASHKNDLQYVIDRKITTMAYQVQVMPNAPMNDPAYREKYKIVTNDEGYVISTSSFTEKDLSDICTLFLAFQFFYVLGVAKYIAYYLQLEHAIKAMDFFDALLGIDGKTKDKYPFSAEINNTLICRLNPRNVGILELHWKTEDSAFLFNRLDEYYEELFRLVSDRFGVVLPASEKETLKAVQMAVMPSMGKRVPAEVELEHDFVSYFDQIKVARIVDHVPSGFVTLGKFPRGKLVVHALKPKVIDNLALVMTDPKTGFGWELRSPLRFVTPRVRKKSAVD